jgi:hypothetical protein
MAASMVGVGRCGAILSGSAAESHKIEQNRADVVASSPTAGAIFVSRQEGRPAGKRNPERRELLGVSHFWRNCAGMRASAW